MSSSSRISGGRQAPGALQRNLKRRRLRRILLGVCELTLGILLLSATRAGAPQSLASAPVSTSDALAARLGPSIESRVQQTASGWHGGSITATTGEELKIFISDSLTPQQASAQEWADFFARLPHRTELSLVKVWIATPGEIEGLCGANAEGCYDPDRQSIYMPGGTPKSAVVATHEYAHHIERNRLNPPWRAEDYGPKRWAAQQNICTRATRGTVFPGNEDAYYVLNPGEGFAETYRALIDTKNGTPITWPIVDWSFYPDAAALGAAEADVMQPWAGPTITTVRLTLTPKIHQRTLNVRSSLDGTLEISATISRTAPFEVSLLSANRKTTLARGIWVGPRERQLRYTICGERTFTIRVISRNALTVSTRITTP